MPSHRAACKASCSPLQVGQHQARKVLRSSMPNLIIVTHQQPDNLLPWQGALRLDLLCIAQHQPGTFVWERTPDAHAGLGVAREHT